MKEVAYHDVKRRKNIMFARFNMEYFINYETNQNQNAKRKLNGNCMNGLCNNIDKNIY